MPAVTAGHVRHGQALAACQPCMPFSHRLLAWLACQRLVACASMRQMKHWHASTKNMQKLQQNMQKPDGTY